MALRAHAPSPIDTDAPPTPGLAARLGAAALVALLGAACGGGGGGAAGGGSATFSASAGDDRTVDPLTPVALSGSVTGGAPAWRQLTGPAVTVYGGTDAATLTFVAPEDPTTLTFELAVREAGELRARDEVRIEVVPAGAALTGALLRRIEVAGGGAGRATRLDHDAASQRLFVLDAASGVVHAFDVADPAAPVLAGTLPSPQPKPGFVAGRPVDVVAEDGVLAVVHEAVSRQVPGRVVFYDPLTLAELSSWSTGAGPSDADITPDGAELAIACAGDLDPNAVADPRGSVTWVHVPPGGPGAIDPTLHVRQSNFAGYDLRRAELLARGVRLPRPNVDVSRDLEPRAVAFTPDGSQLVVSLPANNALARLDTASLVTLEIAGLPLADWSGDAGEVSSLAGLRPVEYRVDRPMALTAAGQSVPRFDGEAVLGVVPGALPGQHVVELVTARGPVLEPQQLDADPELERAFVFGALGPRILRLALDDLAGTVELLSETPLRRSGGAELTSAPNLRASAPGLAHHDDAAVDLAGAPLALDPLGLSVGDAARIGGDLWVADRYRPSLARCDSNGVLLARYVPNGANAHGAVVGDERLPAVYAQRVLDGGFDGVAGSLDGARVFTILARPLDNPDSADDAVSRGSRIVRVLALARTTGMVLGEYAYVLERAGHVVRDLDVDAQGRLVVLEQDPAGSFCALFRVELAGATDLAALGAGYAAVSAALEGTAPADLVALPTPVVPLAKCLALDLGEAGVRATAFLARGGERELPLLLAADAHGLAGAQLDPGTGRLDRAPFATGPVLTLTPFGAPGRQLDASDRDEGAAPSSWPVQGLRQALDLVTLEVDGEVLVLGADGGAPRVLTGTPGYDETVRLGDVLLDSGTFPEALALARPEALGRLRISRVDGDPDLDGLYERLLAFGGRSVFAARLDGSLAWDSGDRLERRVVAREPARAARLEAAAPDGGLAPRSLALVEVGGVRHLVVGCLGSGSLAAFDLAVPRAPRFAGFLPSGVLADPVDLVAVPAGDSPNGRALLFAVDAAAGTVDVLQF